MIWRGPWPRSSRRWRTKKRRQNYGNSLSNRIRPPPASALPPETTSFGKRTTNWLECISFPYMCLLFSPFLHTQFRANLFLCRQIVILRNALELQAARADKRDNDTRQGTNLYELCLFSENSSNLCVSQGIQLLDAEARRQKSQDLQEH